MPAPLLVLAALLALPDGEVAYAPPGAGFRVAMPVAPAERTRRVATAGGVIDVHFGMAVRGDLTYITSHSVRGVELALLGPDRLLDGAARAAADGLGGVLVANRPIRVASRPGREVEFSFDGPDGRPGLGRGRLLLDGPRMVSQTVLGPRDDVQAEGGAFFGSLALTNPPPIEPPPPAEPTARAFESRAEGFRVAMPAPPREERRTYRTAHGTIESHYFVATKGGLSFIVSASRTVEGTDARPPSAVLDGVVQGSVGPKGTLVSRRDAPLGRLPGTAFDYRRTSADGRVVYSRSRAIAAEGRTYQLVVSGPEAEVASGAGDDFLASFRTAGRPAAVAARPAEGAPR